MYAGQIQGQFCPGGQRIGGGNAPYLHPLEHAPGERQTTTGGQVPIDPRQGCFLQIYGKLNGSRSGSHPKGDASVEVQPQDFSPQSQIRFAARGKIAQPTHGQVDALRNQPLGILRCRAARAVGHSPLHQAHRGNVETRFLDLKQFVGKLKIAGRRWRRAFVVRGGSRVRAGGHVQFGAVQQYGVDAQLSVEYHRRQIGAHEFGPVHVEFQLSRLTFAVTDPPHPHQAIGVGQRPDNEFRGPGFSAGADGSGPKTRAARSGIAVGPDVEVGQCQV